ncbi:MAG: hypothetical protein HZA91_10225 [Verrucomicrobia bacterium]|nr:hypothetical protein [Verrucomicrobiota bacterium]
MKTQLISCLCLAMAAIAANSATLHEQLREAATAEGTRYLTARGEITSQGKVVLPALHKAADDSALTWQQRLMARICCEWLERGTEIDALRKHSWETDPESDMWWKSPRLVSRAGLGADLFGLALQRFRERRLWYYYVEIIWKSTGEYRIPRDSSFHGFWPRYAHKALCGEPEFYFVIRILRERLQRDPRLEHNDTRDARVELYERKTGEAIPELLLTLKACHGIPADTQSAEWHTLQALLASVDRLIRMARPQDADLISRYIAEYPQLQGLNPKVDALRKRPPVAEPAEPSFEPGH